MPPKKVKIALLRLLRGIDPLFFLPVMIIKNYAEGHHASRKIPS
jgi:hypothetical protein